MCGITGFFSYRNKINLSKYYDAHLKIAHRGPDDEGFIYKTSKNKMEHCKGNDTILEFQNKEHITNSLETDLVFGHRRLSIIDLTYEGHQPFMYKNLYLIYNGEIFNYKELRADLLEQGYEFKTKSDTEVFLIAYHYWGIDAFNKFNGMWAAAIYDSQKDEVILTRDRFGIKPLYYSLENKNLLFGSEIKFLRPLFDKISPNEQMIYEYISNGRLNHNFETMFKEINQVPTGSYLVYSKEKNQIYKYWTENKDYDNSIEDVYSTFIDSIKKRLRSDVNVGALLSGGMDSSSIINTIHHNNLLEDMQTYTITFKEKQYDYERKYVEDTINKTGFSHKNVYFEPRKELLDEMIKTIEFPYRAFSEHAMNEIYKGISELNEVKVLLNGDGADEIFTGYTEHYFFNLASLFQSFKWGCLYKEISSYSKKFNISKLSIFKDTIKLFIKEKLIRNYNHKLYDNFFVPQFKLTEKYNKYNDILENKLYNNRYFTEMPEYLLYADKISMKYSLEVRLPFLDFRMVNKIIALENSQKVNDATTKVFLKNMMNNILPQSIIKRKDKKGFYAPYELWLNNELYSEINGELETIKNEGLFNFIDHNKIFKYYEQNNKYVSQLMWRVYNLSRWKKIWRVSSD